MDRDRLLLGLAAVFAGLTTLLAVVALAEQPFLLLLALPFAATTYFLWYHASGRLKARAGTRTRRTTEARFGRDGRAGSGPRGRERRASAEAGGGVGAGRRRRRTDGRTRGAGGGAVSTGPSRAEAYRTLDLQPGAEQAEIRRAYRDKVKTTHPDTETGDEESFKRLNRAYERLNE